MCPKCCISHEGAPYVARKGRHYNDKYELARTIFDEAIEEMEKLRLAPVTNLPKGMLRKVAVSMLSASFVGIIGWWLEEGMKHTSAQVTVWLRHFPSRGYLKSGPDQGFRL